MKKEVLLWTGAGQIGMAIARRVGYGKTIVVGDRSLENAQRAAGIMEAAGFDVIPMEMDLSSRTSIRGLIQEGQRHGEITMLVNATGVSPVRPLSGPFCRWICTVPPYCWRRWAGSSRRAGPG